jgi:L-threonylcarbamoyladenylate synthase
LRHRDENVVNTEIAIVNPINPEPLAVARAAELLRAGRLVAFPTETVYGLGANALDPVAVRGIFRAKGRPPSNPLIVHVRDTTQVANVAAEWPATAARLAERFWPGPLTIVVPRRPEVAPSANRSTELSPTRAEHVVKSLGGRIDMILDGGPCPGGIESTVVDVTGPVVHVLRPGPITVPMLEEVVGKVDVASKEEEIARSPGHMERHYSPRTPLRLVDGNDILEDSIEANWAGLRVGSVHFSRDDATWNEAVGPRGRVLFLPANPIHAAVFLYDALFRLDQAGLDRILVEQPPDTPEWAAIRDRLIRAAGRS